MAVPALEIKTSQARISFPKGTRILVDQGDMVEAEKVLGETEENFQEFNLAKTLKTPPGDVLRFLLVTPGMKVKVGDLIAVRKSFLGEIVFKSPVSGIFSELLPEGFLKIKVGEKEEFRSPVRAKVLEVGENEILLGFKAAVFTGEFGTGGENWGQIVILEKEEVTLADLSGQILGKILLIPGKITPGFLHKAEALGALGVVGGFLGGNAKTEETVVVAAHDKEDLISPEIWDTFIKYKGKMALIKGEEKCLEIPLD